MCAVIMTGSRDSELDFFIVKYFGWYVDESTVRCQVMSHVRKIFG